MDRLIIDKECQRVQKTLKPCPFCGTEPTVFIKFINHGEVNQHSIGCVVCNFSFTQLWSFEDIIIKWNCRAEVQNEEIDK